MSEKVLIVDDDPNVLKAYERRLRRRFEIETALCSEEGVTAVDILGPFAVVVSDMMMPRENGAEFLAKILRTAPDSVRIMLTGNADQKTAAAAINQGHVFRFLNKPCEADVLEAAIEEGIAEYQRVTAERRLLNGTLVGAVDMLAKVLAMVNPEGFSSGVRLKQTVSEIAEAGGWGDAWRHETAALLAQVGQVAVPPSILEKHHRGQPLTPGEQASLDTQVDVASELISTVPRLEDVARVVAAQDETEFSEADLEDTDGPRSSHAFAVRLLRLVRDYDELLHHAALSRLQALDRLVSQSDDYDAECLELLERAIRTHEQRVLVSVGVSELVDGMHLVSDVVTEDGALLVAKGQDVSPSLRQRLTSYATTHSVCEPIEALATVETEAAATGESGRHAAPQPA